MEYKQKKEVELEERGQCSNFPEKEQKTLR